MGEFHLLKFGKEIPRGGRHHLPASSTYRYLSFQNFLDIGTDEILERTCYIKNPSVEYFSVYNYMCYFVLYVLENKVQKVRRKEIAARADYEKASLAYRPACTAGGTVLTKSNPRSRALPTR
jgi:hypothetical protein